VGRNLIYLHQSGGRRLSSVGVMKTPPYGPLPNNVLPGDFALDSNLALETGYSFGNILFVDRI
jgi:hypothetical protein